MTEAKLDVKTKNGKYSILVGTNFLSRLSKIFQTNRIKNSQKRPIAIKLSDLDLNKLINDRSKIYSKAKYQIKCDRITKTELIERIIRLNDKG